jgi:hypothetical protein
MNLRFLLIVVMGLSLTACFPVHFLVQPAISGSVVDDSTSVPVANATVILSRSGSSDRPLIATVTDTNGQFALPVRRAWGVYMMPEDVFDFGGTVDIYASGYLKVSRQVRAKLTGTPVPILLGEIRVKQPR